MQRRDRQKKKNSTINLTSVNGVCFWCLPQTSPLTLDVTTNKFFTVQQGTPKYILKNYNNYIIPRLTLLMETFIHTYNHSFTVLFSKSINSVFHFLGNCDFLDTSFSWTLSFLLGPYFSSFSLGIIYLTSIRGSPPHSHNSVDLRTRLPGCVDHQVCSTYVSTPQSQPSGPGPGCYL